jgi:16S rRNA U1498 N3-methylase RsmE
MHNTKQSKNNSRNYPQYSNTTQKLTQLNQISIECITQSKAKIIPEIIPKIATPRRN